MTKRLLSSFLLTTFFISILTPALAVAKSDHDHTSIEAHHEGGTPCPDGDDHGPCNDGCACLCCPGHFIAHNPLAIMCATVDSSATNYEFTLSDDHHPSGFLRGVFRPPRA